MNREPLRNENLHDGSRRDPAVMVAAVFRRHATAPAIIAGAITVGFVLAGCGDSGGGPDAAPVESSMTTVSTVGSTNSGSSVVTIPAGTDGSAVAENGGPAASSDAASTDAASTDATDETTASTAAAAPSTATDQTAPPTAVPAALDFTANLVDGSEIEMGQYAGRPVLLWFWAPW